MVGIKPRSLHLMECSHYDRDTFLPTISRNQNKLFKQCVQQLKITINMVSLKIMPLMYTSKQGSRNNSYMFELEGLMATNGQ
jgi:hypothetical protein